MQGTERVEKREQGENCIRHVAPNKFVAKIASDVKNPEGFVVVEAGLVQEFLDPLPVGRIWGVGKVTGRNFDGLTVRTIGLLRELSVETLKIAFGAAGEHYWKLRTASTSVASFRTAGRSRSRTRRHTRKTSATWTCCGCVSSNWLSRSPGDCGDTPFAAERSN